MTGKSYQQFAHSASRSEEYEPTGRMGFTSHLFTDVRQADSVQVSISLDTNAGDFIPYSEIAAQDEARFGESGVEAMEMRSVISEALSNLDLNISGPIREAIQTAFEHPRISAVECWPSSVFVEDDGVFSAAATIVVRSSASGLGGEKMMASSDLPARVYGRIADRLIVVDQVAMQLDATA